MADYKGELLQRIHSLLYWAIVDDLAMAEVALANVTFTLKRMSELSGNAQMAE